MFAWILTKINNLTFFFVHSSVIRHEGELNSRTLSEKWLSMSVFRVCALRKPDQIEFSLASQKCNWQKNYDGNYLSMKLTRSVSCALYISMILTKEHYPLLPEISLTTPFWFTINLLESRTYVHGQNKKDRTCMSKVWYLTSSPLYCFRQCRKRHVLDNQKETVSKSSPLFCRKKTVMRKEDIWPF